MIGTVPTTWSVVATGDLNADGRADIVWRDTSGNVAIWLMNGSTVLQSSVLGIVPTNWVIVETGDFDGDGEADLLLAGRHNRRSRDLVHGRGCRHFDRECRYGVERLGARDLISVPPAP